MYRELKNDHKIQGILMLKKMLISVLLLWTGLCLTAIAKDNVAVTVKYKGEVRITPESSFKTAAVKKGQVFQHGDKVETGPASFCSIKFLDDKSLLRIKEKSVCIIEGKKENNAIEKNIFVEVGTFFLSLFQQKENLKVTTPTSVASVKGTKFWCIQIAGQTMYICTEGSIEVGNNAGKVLVRKGQTCIVVSRSRLPEVRLTKPSDIPSDSEGGGDLRNLDFEFTDGSGQTKTLRLKLQTQE